MVTYSPLEAAMPYEIYVNHVHNKAIIHRSGCGTLRQHGGGDSEIQYYSEPIESWEQTVEQARATNKKIIRTHRVCLPNIVLAGDE